MRTLAIGITPLSCCCGGGSSTSPAMRLSGLGVFQEDIAAGAALGTLSVVNVTGTPAYTLTDSDGGRVILTGANLTRGIAWDYETHPIVTATISVSGVTPTIAPRTFLLFATNVLEVTLAALGLSPSTIPEGSVAGTVVGAITGKTGGSSLTLTDDAGGRFAILGTNLVTTSIPTDYETSTLHAITIRETHPDAAPRDTALAVTVTNVAEATLAALTLSSSTVAENATIGTVVGGVLGQTSGSTLSLTGTAGGLFALSGTNIVTAGALDYETATSHSITIRETYAEASNSPRDTVRTITVTDITEASFGPFTLAWTSAATERTNVSFSLSPAPAVGDSVVIAFDNNSDMSSPFTTSAANVIDSTEAASGSLTFTGVTLPLPANVITYARATVSRSGFANVNTTIASATLYDQFAFTVASSFNNTENTLLNQPMSGTEVATYTIVGGADAARFQLAAGYLQWAGNITKDFEAPNDVGLNNTYEVTVRATATAVPANTADRTFTVTVTNVVEGGGWTSPLDASTPAVWWVDANNAGSLTMSGSEPNKHVSQWNDLSGNNRHITSKVLTEDLLYTSNVLNSKPGLYAGPSSTVRTPAFTLGQRFMLCIVWKQSAIATSSFGILWDGDRDQVAATRAVIFTAHAGSGGNYSPYAGTLPGSGQGVATAINTAYHSRVEFNGASTTSVLNGSSLTLSVGTGGIVNGIAIGGESNAPFSYLCEMFVIPNPTGADHTNAAAYTLAKWGV